MSIDNYETQAAHAPASKPVAARHSKRSVLLSGKKTSISLEDEFWSALRRIAGAEGKSISELITSAPLDRRLNLSSALRVFILRHYEKLAGLP
jgi:predicted DNA-binding ribbon-helix-helix protein